jgi:hypothetical protein
MHRRIYSDIKEMFHDYPSATTYFNCTGLGAAKLKGVQDADVYPTKVCSRRGLNSVLGLKVETDGIPGPSDACRIP